MQKNNLGFAVLGILLLGAVAGAFIVYVGHLNQPGNVGVVTK